MNNNMVLFRRSFLSKGILRTGGLIPHTISKGIRDMSKLAYYYPPVPVTLRGLNMFRANMGLEHVFLNLPAVQRRFYNIQKVLGGIGSEYAKVEGLTIAKSILNSIFSGNGLV